MQRLNTKKVNPSIILFLVSILIVFVLTLILNDDRSISLRLSNNFFIVGIVMLIGAVFFETTVWAMHKRYIRKPISKEEIEALKYSHKDAGIVSSIKKEEDQKRNKEMFKMLRNTSIIVGFADIGISIFMLIFIYK